MLLSISCYTAINSAGCSTNFPSSSTSRNMTPEDYLIENNGGIDNYENRKRTEELLSKYNFPANSCHNPLEFAIHYLQYEQIPHWAEQYKIVPIEAQVNDQDGNVHTLSYFANRPIHSGVDGEVFQDSDENYVLKKYHENYNDLDDSEFGAIEKSIAFFRHYYGSEGSSKIYHDDENLFVRMKKIAGIPLSKVDSLPADAIEKFGSMLVSIAEKNIFHSDLQKDNILWDSYEGKFNPIDFGDNPNNYSKLDLEDLLQKMEYDSENCVELIKQKIITSSEPVYLFQEMIFRNLA
ncbi:MAG: hypothetical protein ACL7BU_08840 [Candidatus Phlomobacter fragariae]